MIECTEERFLGNTKDHLMTVIRDDGVYRHLQFRKLGTGDQAFDIITWPWHLCYTGDMGTYVFERLDDMFQFFRMGSAGDGVGQRINPHYWGEKLLSVGTNAGYKEFDKEEFRARVKQYFDDHCEAEEPGEEVAAELWAEIEDEVLSCTDDGEQCAYHAVYNFSHNGFQFEDFLDGGGTEKYTFRYLWCLYAIVWGIQQYDAQRSNPITVDCAAIRGADGTVYSLPRPSRHSDVAGLLVTATTIGKDEGFLLIDGRFVDRYGAALVAQLAGQIEKLPESLKLRTNDLW